MTDPKAIALPGSPLRLDGAQIAQLEVVAGGGERDPMKSLAVRVVVGCVVVFALSSCQAIRKFETDFEKFEVNFRALLQGTKTPIAKADKVARKHPANLKTKQVERDSQARIFANASEEQKIIRATTEAGSDSDNRVAATFILPRPAPRNSDEFEALAKQQKGEHYTPKKPKDRDI